MTTIIHLLIERFSRTPDVVSAATYEDSETGTFLGSVLPKLF